MIDRKWNSERPLVFAHVVLTKTLDACKAREIRAIIDRRLDLWERVIYAGLVGDALAEGRARDGRIKRCVEEEEDSLARISHINVLSGKLHQAVCWAMNRKEGGGGAFSRGTSARRPGDWL